MALEDMAPTLEELALTTVDGHQCMPGVETNLGELLTTAALAKPDSVCLETQDGCFTFLQARVQGLFRTFRRCASSAMCLCSAVLVRWPR